MKRYIKSSYIVQALQWIGEPTETEENGFNIYSPGNELKFQDLQEFETAEEADDYIAEMCHDNGYSLEDFKVVRR